MTNNRRRNHNRYEKPQWEVEKERMEEERQKALENTEENFPSLGRNISAKPNTWLGRRFTELAADWKAEDDDRKAAEDIQNTQGRDVRPDTFVMPQFTLRHHYVEPEDEEYEEEEEISAPQPIQPPNEEEDGWVTVDSGAKKRARMIRKQRRYEDRMRRLDDGEEIEPEHDENDEQPQDDTCWNTNIAAAPMGKHNDS